ncbi:MAG TPA: hypothetical protein VGO09_07875, partial [Flavisolibacter sp.]|nr:hypothetical protein [Flavisolibacter sp.]
MKHILSRKAILLPLILIVLQSTAQQTYYVKHDGNDALDGHTIATAWASPEKVDSTVFNAGDSILFEGGFSFRGMLTLPHANSGTSSNPIVLSSYGGPMATINGGDSLGLYVQNVAGMVVKKLIFTTSSPLTNATDGLSFFMDQATNLDYILIDSVEVSGFGGNGITVGNGGAGGYSNVSIMHSLAHDNKGNAGISTYSNLNNFANTNIHVAYCKSYNNTGKPGGAPLTDASTGSGITIGGVTGATVEYCVAYNNGQNNNAINGGPVGIWTYESKNVIIQYCESYKNFAGSTVDGGGFDIDGGTQNCIVQYCYSHGNEGAGFAFFQYNAPDIFSNNVIRYNISENDGRKNNYGAISLWGYDGTHQITNSAVYNNTIYVDDVTLIINGVPEAVQLVSTNMTNIEIANNIFYVAGTLKLVNSPNPPPTTAGILFQNNDYYAPSGFNIAWGATSITDLNTWRTSPTSSGQEMNGGSPVGTTGNPLLTGPLGAGTIINPSYTANHLDSLSAYKIQSGSAA